MAITTFNQDVTSLAQTASLIPTTPLALSLPQSQPMTCAILSNLLHPLEDLHIAALSLVVPSNRPPPLLQLGLTLRIVTSPCEGDPYPTPDLCQISVMTVSANRSLSQRTGNLDSIPTQLPDLNLCSTPLLSPILKGPPITPLLMQTESLGKVPGTGALNGTIGGTAALAVDLMSDRALLTTDVTRLINVMETTIVSMINCVLVVLPLLPTDRVTTVFPGIMMSAQQLLVLRITNNHLLRMVEMTGRCHHRPLLLLCLTFIILLLHHLRLVLKGSAEPLTLTLRPCFPLMLLQFGALLTTVPRDSLPWIPKMNARHSKKGLADNHPSHCKKGLACPQVLIPVRLREPPDQPFPWKNDFPIRPIVLGMIVAADRDLILLLLPARQSAL